jgi:hypothetical protein
MYTYIYPCVHADINLHTWIRIHNTCMCTIFSDGLGYTQNTSIHESDHPTHTLTHNTYTRIGPFHTHTKYIYTWIGPFHIHTIHLYTNRTIPHTQNTSTSELTFFISVFCHSCRTPVDDHSVMGAILCACGCVHTYIHTYIHVVVCFLYIRLFYPSFVTPVDDHSVMGAILCACGCVCMYACMYVDLYIAVC